MKKITFLYLSLMATAIFVLAACGGSEPEVVETPDPVTIEFVTTDEFKWDPASITVESGAEVSIVLENQGALEHNWILARDGIDVATASDADALYGANVGYVQGGETGDLTFIAPGPGTYKYVCTVAGHAAGGMVGDLIVE
ncbi:MAG: plastocyanin/azurin family copper-binding protein [Anaerolineae bacterium]